VGGEENGGRGGRGEKRHFVRGEESIAKEHRSNTIFVGVRKIGVVRS